MDRFGIKKSMSVIVAGSGISTAFLGLTSGVGLLLIIFIQPVMVACFFPAGVAALSKIGSQHAINMIVSMMIPISILFGTGVVPNLLGFLGEYSTFAIGFDILGATILLSTVLLIFLELDQ